MSRRERDRGRTDKKRERALASRALVPAGISAAPAERGFAECPCPKDCTLHGECELCVAYHASEKVLPRCERV